MTVQEYVASIPNMHKRRSAILRRLPLGPVVVVEVGVSSGLLARGLLEERADLTWHGVDSWQPAEAQPTAYCATRDPHALMSQEQADHLHRLASGRVTPFGPRATIHHERSLVAASSFYDDRVHLVFVDADHSFAGCLADCRAWWPKVRPGGWLGGHDFHPTNLDVDIGVARAVKLFAEEVGQEYALDDGNTWWISKP